MRKAHDEVKELLGAYALGAVPADEMPAIRDHILTCDECMAEADDLSDTSSLLLLMSDPVQPPAGFADRVMATATEARDSATARPAPRRSFFERFSRVLAAASLLVAVFFGTAYWRAQSDANQQREIVASLLREDGLRLKGTSGAVAKAVPAQDGSVFAVDGLQDAPEGSTYQLWYISEGRPASAGVFDAEDGMAVIEVPRNLSEVDAVAVTIEPSGGVESPTGDPILSSEA